jgi:glycosyltransferase involved in cell wall biosynthesis
VEKFLGRCLQSVLEQSFSDFEVIVVDDGSTDHTWGIAADYAARDARIRVLRQENQGQGAARNAGMDLAQGEYLLFIDGDDAILPGMLASLYTAAKRFDNVQLVFCNTKVVNEKGERIGCFSERFPENTLLSVQERKDLILMAPGPVSKLYQRRWFIDLAIRFPGGVWYEDLRTTVKLAARLERAVYVPEEWYCYYQRTGSTMHNQRLWKNREIMEAFDDLMGYFNQRKEFAFELEYLALYHLYLAASVRVVRIDPASPLLTELKSYMHNYFPSYADNPYLNRLDSKERMVFTLLEHKAYRTLHFLYWFSDRRKERL